MPAATEFGSRPRVVDPGSGRVLPQVAGTGWKDAGLFADIAPAAAVTWDHVPVTDTVMLHAALSPDSVYVFGFRAVDAAGLPLERDEVHARCDAPVQARIACVTQPVAPAAGGGLRVRITTAPSTVRYVTIQASWVLLPRGSTAAVDPVEVSGSWITRRGS